MNNQNEQLYHHGILGQKWGRRRWQNEDGSLTPAGKEHYGKLESVYKDTARVFGEASKLPPGKGTKRQSGSYPEMTDEELQKKVNRLSLESRYSDLVGDTKYTKTGSEWTHEILQDVGILATVAASATGIYLAIKGAKNVG